MIEETVKELITLLIDTKSIFIISTVMIIADILSGYIKAFKNKNYNSSINRDGLARKMMWFLMLLLGVVINFVVHFNAITIIVGASCVFCEFMSIIENAKDVGIEFSLTKFVGSDEDEQKK